MEPVGWSLWITRRCRFSIFRQQVGHSAAKLQIVSFNGIGIPPLLSANYISITESYGSLIGYYKFAPSDANEILTIAVIMSHGGSITGGGGLDIREAASSYTQFVVPISYTPGETADTAYIQIDVADTSDNNAGIGAMP